MKKKTILCLTLCLALTTTLIGCNNKKSGSSGSGSGSVSGSASDSDLGGSFWNRSTEKDESKDTSSTTEQPGTEAPASEKKYSDQMEKELKHFLTSYMAGFSEGYDYRDTSKLGEYVGDLLTTRDFDEHDYYDTRMYPIDGIVKTDFMKDPRGSFAYDSYQINGEKLDWVLENVYNWNKDSVNRVKDLSGYGWYYEGGYYYGEHWDGAGGADIELESCEQKDGMYLATFKYRTYGSAGWHGEDDEWIATCYAILDYKDFGGTGYWSMYKSGDTPLDEEIKTIKETKPSEETTTEAPKSTSTDWVAAYRALANEGVGYAFDPVYLDNDDIPELIMKSGPTIEIYTVKNGKAEMVDGYGNTYEVQYVEKGSVFGMDRSSDCSSDDSTYVHYFEVYSYSPDGCKMIAMGGEETDQNGVVIRCPYMWDGKDLSKEDFEQKVKDTFGNAKKSNIENWYETEDFLKFLDSQ